MKAKLLPLTVTVRCHGQSHTVALTAKLRLVCSHKMDLAAELALAAFGGHCCPCVLVCWRYLNQQWEDNWSTFAPHQLRDSLRATPMEVRYFRKQVRGSKDASKGRYYYVRVLADRKRSLRARTIGRD